jgi:hypothetical protein
VSASPGGRAGVVVVWCDRPGVSRALAAGTSFTNRTLNAGWAARFGHTSVVDAVSGAIYVIGGRNGGTYYQDVWASTDGGADRTRSKGGGRGGTTGYYRGYSRRYERC